MQSVLWAEKAHAMLDSFRGLRVDKIVGSLRIYLVYNRQASHVPWVTGPIVNCWYYLLLVKVIRYGEDKRAVTPKSF